METTSEIKVSREPFASYAGAGVRVAIIDSGVNPAHPHVCGVAGGVRITASETDSSNDYLDYLGHGTAVAGAIREKAPDAQLYALKVFDRVLTTNIEVIIKAIDWCIENLIDVANLSLGTVNPEHREVMEMTVARAANNGIALVAACKTSDKLSFPGCLPSVIGVAVDWQCPRSIYTVRETGDGSVFVASAYPRDIPGVPRERNLNGISFAVANMTGFVARAKEMARTASVAQLKQLLVEEATCE